MSATGFPGPATRPHPETPQASVMWESLISQQAATRQLLDHHERLVELIRKLETPARCEAIMLTAAQPVVESGALSEPSRSVGLLNPSGSPGAIAFSVMGSANAADAFVVPVGKLLVLPIGASVVEIGTSVALGANTLYCFLLRFQTVQPAYLGG